MYSRTFHRILSLLLVLAVVLAFGATNRASAQQSSGTVLADVGFRPDGNGFGFSNYGGDPKVTNLTPADMRRLFGDAACARLNGDTCDLVPQVQQIMDTFNGSMNGGHCEGMAVLSELFYSGQLKPADFGQDSPTALPFDSNSKLQREIAYWFSTQFLKVIANASIKDKSPKDIVNFLVQAMKDKKEYYVVHIFQPGYKGGHAVSPYEVLDMGNGIERIMVYDNNWPKDGNRYVEVDTNANTWTYLAATDPTVPESVYKGDASTLTLQLAPISPRLGQLPCVFCKAYDPSTQVKAASGLQQVAFITGNRAAQTEADNYQISLETTSEENDTDLLLTDAQGHRLGYQGGQFYSEIPGDSFIPGVSDNLFKDNPEPDYFIPTGTAVTITIDGSAVKTDEVSSVSLIGPGYDLAVEDIHVKPGEKDTLILSPDGTKITYTPSGDEAPNLVVGLQHSGADWEFNVKGADVQPGSTVTITLDESKGRLGIETTGSGEKTTTYAIQVDRIDTNAHDVFTHDGLSIDPSQQAYIEYGTWDGKGDLNVTVGDKTQAESNTTK
ncbi:MAG TPA: hypothetical protein VKQ72_10065 [Aggregatilineales bacterium]|nr:hypothetical protein [Aggregatilineales bacterium]